jgi:hypothetical protein
MLSYVKTRTYIQGVHVQTNGGAARVGMLEELSEVSSRMMLVAIGTFYMTGSSHVRVLQ